MEFFKKLKWDGVIISCLTIVLGILCVAMPSTSATALCYIFGGALLIMGITFLVRYFAVERLLGSPMLITAVVMTMCGLFCIVYPGTVQGILTVLFGVFILVDSINTMTDSIILARTKVKGWFVMFLLSLLTACLGVAIMFSTFDAVMIFAGVSLIFEGVKDLVLIFTFGKKVKDAKKKIESQTDEDVIIVE